MKLGVFYHTRISGGDPEIRTDHALKIVQEQSRLLKDSGLAERADRLVVGVNGDEFDQGMLSDIVPAQASIVAHGPESVGEFRTLLEAWEYAKGSPQSLVCYFHTKGATKPDNSTWDAWRQCMGRVVIGNWKQCVDAIESGKYDMAGAHWLRPLVHKMCRHFWGGNFWWCRASHLARLPSPLGTLNTRYDAEVWLTRGSLDYRALDFAPHWPGPLCRSRR